MNAVVMLDAVREQDDWNDSTDDARSPGWRNRTSREKFATTARFRRGGRGASSFNGAHRRRQKRNGL